MNSKDHKNDAFLIATQQPVVKKMKYMCKYNRMSKASNYWKVCVSLYIYIYIMHLIIQSDSSEVRACVW